MDKGYLPEWDSVECMQEVINGRMKHLGLFEGIGGFSLAARWMGWDTIAWCEINPFCQKVLKHHFPNATGHDDITATDFTIYWGQCDILTGGFPCQPYSTAGKRLGTADERHLWPEMLRAIREIKPRWVVGENVSGLINWNGGLVFEQVQTDLEAEGYEVQAFILPACGVNAPHRRDRIWFVAHSESSGMHGEKGNVREANGGQRAELLSKLKQSGGRYGIEALTPYAGGEGLERRGWEWGGSEQRGEGHSWALWPTQSPICNGNDGIPSELDGITFPKWRQESLKGGGNAVVPQIPFMIYKAISEYENLSP